MLPTSSGGFIVDKSVASQKLVQLACTAPHLSKQKPCSVTDYWFLQVPARELLIVCEKSDGIFLT